MAEQITTTCPVCGLLAVRVQSGPEADDGSGWGTKWICYNQAHPRWQEAGPKVPRQVPERNCRVLWAMLNGLTIRGAPPAEATRIATVRVARQALFDGTGMRLDVDSLLEFGEDENKVVRWRKSVDAAVGRR